MLYSMLVELFEIRPNLGGEMKIEQINCWEEEARQEGVEEGRKQSIVSMVNLSYMVLYKI